MYVPLPLPYREPCYGMELSASVCPSITVQFHKSGMHADINPIYKRFISSGFMGWWPYCRHTSASTLQSFQHHLKTSLLQRSFPDFVL